MGAKLKMNKVKELIKSLLGVKRPKGYEWYSYQKTYFGQEGEDIILEQIFGNKKTGFYIDVGAHHPFKYSNTFLFYLKGWRGINIDPLPGSMALFKKYRQEDLNLEIAVSEKKGVKTYYMFSIPELNGFKRNTVLDKNQRKEFPLIGKTNVKVDTLNSILRKNYQRPPSIDFLSIDTEGYEIQVLRSIDLDKYSPRAICLEDRNAEKQDPSKSNVAKYLNKKGYRIFTKTMHSLFFIKNP